MIDKNQITQWNERLYQAASEEILSFFLEYFKDKIAFQPALDLKTRL